MQHLLETLALGATQQCVLFGKNVFFGKSATYKGKFALTTESVYKDLVGNIGLKKLWQRKKYLKVLFLGKSGAFKSKYTLKPLLSQNMVHFN